MTANITCYVGITDEDLQMPALDGLLNQPLNQIISASSSYAGGERGINLELSLKRKLYSLTRKPTTAFMLNHVLHKLLGRPQATGKRKINRIGLIYARHYYAGNQIKPGVLGIMFDAGFFVPELGQLANSHYVLPRQGCAVFLDSIKRHRQGEDYLLESLFTSIHELGHVFNLWHEDTPDNLNFMTTSHISKAYDHQAFQFTTKQKKYLSHCHHQNQHSDYVHPGASHFDQRGPLAHLMNSTQFNSVESHPLAIDISINRKEVLYFEPLELDIKLRTHKTDSKPVIIPDIIDPGYEQFIIWIEAPDGSKRKYKSPRHYCANLENIEITNDHPFERDISIFGQSGGYTFYQPGVYKILVELRLNQQTVLKSNTIELKVRGILQNSRQENALAQLLTTPANAKLLYHRQGQFTQKLQQSLEQARALALAVNPVLAADISYAIASYLDNISQYHNSQNTRLWQDMALKHVDKALNCDQLKGHKINKYLNMNASLTK